jgi:hypothetical protein
VKCVPERVTLALPLILILQADPFDPDWKATFYGSNYDKLLAIKDKWDPDQMLYGTTAVGGDRWTQASDGRLCKA